MPPPLWIITRSRCRGRYPLRPRPRSPNTTKRRRRRRRRWPTTRCRRPTKVSPRRPITSILPRPRRPFILFAILRRRFQFSPPSSGRITRSTRCSTRYQLQLPALMYRLPGDIADPSPKGSYLKSESNSRSYSPKLRFESVWLREVWENGR